jgi:hypothetical protein
MIEVKSLDLTDQEIEIICAGLVQNAAKIRYLRALGLTVHRKPNGRPLVCRAHYDSIMGGSFNTQTMLTNGPIWGVH